MHEIRLPPLRSNLYFYYTFSVTRSVFLIASLSVTFRNDIRLYRNHFFEFVLVTLYSADMDFNIYRVRENVI